MIHQHDLEAQLTIAFEKHVPEMIGNEYLVIGTVNLKTWQSGLKGEPNPLERVLEHAADFASRLDLHVTPGGWRPAR